MSFGNDASASMSTDLRIRSLRAASARLICPASRALTTFDHSGCSVTSRERRGRPRLLPSARARSIPALTRSVSYRFSS